MTTQNDFKSLVQRLNDLRYNGLSESQIAKLKAKYDDVGSKIFSMAVSEVENTPNLPNNLLGFTVITIDRILEVENNKTLEKKDWRAKELCTSSKEYRLYMSITKAILNIHATGRLKSQKSNFQFTDVEQWIRAGKPKTWSPLVDKLLEGYERVYKSNKCEDYLRQFRNFLKQEFKI